MQEYLFCSYLKERTELFIIGAYQITLTRLRLSFIAMVSRYYISLAAIYIAADLTITRALFRFCVESNNHFLIINARN